MRFSVAIVLLAGQVVPASTEEAQSILPSKAKQRRRVERILASSAAKTNNDSPMKNAFAFAAKDRRHGIDGFNSEEITAKKFKTGDMLKNKNQKNHNKQCDPKSDDPDVGILSCGGARYCVESIGSPLGGLCMEPIRKTRSPFGGMLKNKKHSTKKACDPNAGQDGADVGLLACGMGHYCKESGESLLGGFCASEVAVVDINIARRAEHYGTGNYTGHFDGGNYTRNLERTPEILCSNYTTLYNCDCEDFDFAAGDGTIPCTIPSECKACNDACASIGANYTFVANASASNRLCLYLTSPYERKICYSYDYDVNGAKGTCEYSLDNQVCDLCTVATYECRPFGGPFDYTNTNIPNATAGDSCGDEADFLLPIFEDLGADFTCLEDTAIYENCWSPSYLFDDDKNCDCSGVDLMTLTGSFECSYFEPLCFDPATCAYLSTSYYSSVDRSVIVDARCTALSDSEFCYTKSSALSENELTCSVNGVDCYSCVVAMIAGGANADVTCDFVDPFINFLVNNAPVMTDTDSPVMTDSPIEITNSPVMTDSPVEITEAPAMTDSPVEITEAPAMTDSPVEITKAPAMTDSPVTTDSPVMTPSPVTEFPTASPMDGAHMPFKSSQAVTFFAITAALMTSFA